MITVITTTIGGRDLYLGKACKSVINSVQDEEIEHIIVFNGIKAIPEILSIVKSSKNPENYKPKWIELRNTISIGEVLNLTRTNISGDLVMKMDDDCLIQSSDFFNHVRAINKLEPRACFSPYPVGLIGNPGGVPSTDRKVIFSAETNTYYTLRRVPHIGGFARIYPALYAKNMLFAGSKHDEDVQFSNRFREVGFYYLENAIIVEHQESTLGQHVRYGDNYFKGRF